MASPAPDPAKSKATLTGAQATLLITLYGRYLDATSDDPILGDKFAGLVLEKIDYDFATIGVGKGTIYMVGTRGQWLDNWVLDFLSKTPSATVVHLGCGLDTRAHRLAWGPGVRWIDVDLPDVVELRRKVAPELPGRDYTLLAGSATDPELITTLPNDRPTLIVMEGLTSYLDPVEGQAMISTLCKHFQTGEIAMDASSWLTRRIQRFFSLMWKTGSAVQWVRWGIDPKGLEKLHDGLKLVEVQPIVTIDTVPKAKAGPTMRVIMWMLSLLPVTRNAFRFCRYTY